jgi:DNA-directed RNA polymerase specialized sigma24 family protein
MPLPEPSDSNTTIQSVTEWIALLKEGDQSVAMPLWQRYFERLIRLASRKLAGFHPRVSDENDAVNEVFFALLQGIQQSRFPDLQDRQDLWQILIMLTERQAIRIRRQELSDKRGAHVLHGESVFDSPGSSAPNGIGQVLGAEPTPAFAALCAEGLAMRLASLQHDPDLIQIARDKLSGYSNAEIASRLGSSLRSVERNLSRIRQIWNQD